MKRIRYLLLLLLLFIPCIVYGDSYRGNVIIDRDSDISNKKYSSSIGGEASLFISGGNSTISNSTITKSGNYNILEFNSGLLINNKASIKLNNSNITTNAKNSPSIVSMDESKVEIDGGIFSTNNINSPVIYGSNLGNVIVNNAKMSTKKSVGIIIDRNSNIELNNVDLDINSNNDKNIVIYDSKLDKDIMDYNGIKINESTININHGYVFSLSNVRADVEIRNSKFKGKDNKLFSIETKKNNYNRIGNVSIFMYDSKISGDIDIDNKSYGYITFNNVIFKGSINSKNTADTVSIVISKDSVIILEKDTYINEIFFDEGDYSNIFLNGHNMYADGKKIRGNKGKYLGKDKNGNLIVDNSEEERKNFIVSIVIIIIILLLIGIYYFIKKKKKN